MAHTLSKVFLCISCVYLIGCQQTPHDDFALYYVPPSAYHTNDPYMGNHYRLNTSNYFGNMEYNNSI